MQRRTSYPSGAASAAESPEAGDPPDLDPDPGAAEAAEGALVGTAPVRRNGSTLRGSKAQRSLINVSAMSGLDNRGVDPDPDMGADEPLSP